MATTTTSGYVKPPSAVDEAVAGERKPPLTQMNILVMTLGFFGNSFGFGIVFSAVNPLFLYIGASEHDLPILNIAGPITGLFIQPLIGAFSDKTWSDRWGRRKPYIYGGAFLAAVVLIVFPFVDVLWAAVLCLWLLDIGNNTTAEPYRAFLSDRLPKNQLARGFLTQSFYAGLGSVLANLAIFVFQKFITGKGSNGLPYWMYVCFWLGTVSVVITVIIAMRAGPKELRPSDEDIAEIEAAPKGLAAAVKDIASAVRTMPVAMHKIGVVFMFQWYAMFIYWQFVAVSIGKTAFNASPETGGEAWDAAVSWAGLENATYNFFTMIAALFLIGWVQRVGAKRVQAVCLGLAAISLVALSQITNQYLALVPMIGLGIGWASMIGLPSMMVSTIVSKKQTGGLPRHPEHDDRGPDADPDRHLRLDLREPARQRRQHRHIAGRDPARLRRDQHAVGQPAPAGRGVATHPARCPAAHPGGVRRGDRRLRWHADVVGGRRSRSWGGARGGGEAGPGHRVRPRREPQRPNGRGLPPTAVRERAGGSCDAGVVEGVDLG
jgi:maltose/moltooligosaccharide transporter